MKNIRWGIIGCGDVTEVKSGPAFNLVEGSELVAVMRRDAKKAEDYARRHGVPKWYSDADKLINDPDVDAVYIATPPSSHKDYASAVAQAGKPVYVEKPMALTFAECDEMVEACNQADVPLFVAYYRRALPRFLKVKSLLDEKTIGEIRTVNIRLFKPSAPMDKNPENWRLNPSISGGGYFYDLASHIIDLLQFMLGDIKSAYGNISNQSKLYKAEDTVSASFQFESGVLGSGIWCFDAAEEIELTEITGTKGRITYSNFDDSPITVLKNGKKEEFQVEHPKHIQQPLIQQINDQLHGNGQCPSNGETASRTNWVMDQIFR